jgi:hypothetical protein
MKMEAAQSSETLVSNHHTTRRNNPENHEFSLCSLRATCNSVHRSTVNQPAHDFCFRCFGYYKGLISVVKCHQQMAPLDVTAVMFSFWLPLLRVSFVRQIFLEFVSPFVRQTFLEVVSLKTENFIEVTHCKS